MLSSFSVELSKSLLLDETTGNLPVWLSPLQVKVLTIADRHIEYADKLAQKLERMGIRVEVDAREEKLANGSSIRGPCSCIDQQACERSKNR